MRFITVMDKALRYARTIQLKHIVELRHDLQTATFYLKTRFNGEFEVPEQEYDDVRAILEDQR